MDWMLYLIPVVLLAGFWLARQARFVRPAKARLLLRQRALVVDVRTEAEFRRGNLPGSINLPLADLEPLIKTRAPKKDQVVLMYCSGGTRSAAARRKLLGLGYPNVYNLGGYRRAAHVLRGSV